MRRAEGTNACRSFEFGHAGCGALRFVLKFIGADCSTSSAVVSELLLLIEGAAVEMVDIVIPDGRSSERERCCGGGGVPRRPASGQAGPLARAELSRGTAGQRRGMLEALLAARGGTACWLRLFVRAACMSARESGFSLGVGATRAAALTTMCCRVVVGCV